MAGIGFKLEKILSKSSYMNLVQGYSYSAIVSAGPLLCTIFSIAILTVIAPGQMPIHEVMTFRTLVVYIYAGSLIGTSAAQMIVTRYISDRIFTNDFKAIAPAFVGVTIISLMVHFAAGAIFASFLDLGLPVQVTAVILFLAISIIWIAMIVLSASKDFIWIVKSFIAGASLSVVAGYLFGIKLGLLGLLGGFTIGQVLLVIMLLGQIFSEFEFRPRVEYYFLAYFKKFTALAFIATFYNIGIWIDKFVFWLTPETGERIHSFLHASSVYDVPVFVAYILIVPSLAMFTVRVETSFYIHYRKFFLAILNKHPLSALEERRRNIVNALKTAMGRLIVLQGTITLVGLFLAPKIYPYLGMTSLNLGVFQIAMVATFLQALLQTLLIIMLYFDFRVDALVMSILFATTNYIFTRISIDLGFSYYGYGYFSSCLVSLVTGILIFNYRMKHLLYYTFVSQKIITYREAPAVG